MSRTKELLDELEQERMEKAEKERQFELDEKSIGLSSNTLINRMYVGSTTIEAHWNPDIKEIVVLEVWHVADGQDDTAQEFSVITSFNTLGAFIEYGKRL